MKEYPRIFRGDMVRAILEGRKTQTRVFADDRRFRDIQPGDRLWVRETFTTREICEKNGVPFLPTWKSPRYRANYEKGQDWNYAKAWKPSIHMPRWASRITLEVTGVRVERLREITEEDARAEGILDGGCLNCGESEPCGCDSPKPDARDDFIGLWDSIYPKRGWDKNEEVRVIEFKRVQP